MTDLDANVEPTNRPKLRLHHFFALTAVAAVLLAVHGQQPNYWENNPFQPPQWIMTLSMAWLVISDLLVAVALTAVGYGIAWRRRGLLFFDQPGHWLLVEIAVAGLFSIVPAVVYRWFFTPEQMANFDNTSMMIMWLIWGYTMIFMVLIPVGLNVYFGVRKCRELRWSLVFYFKAAARFVFSMGIGDLLVLPSTIYAAQRDRRERVARDGGHWCGVLVQCAMSGLAICGMLLTFLSMYFMFMRR
jgi:hypothetical protein